MKGKLKRLLAGTLTALLLITTTGFTNPEHNTNSDIIVSEENTSISNTDIDLSTIDINSILDRYYNGDKMSEDLVNLRKKVAEKNNWQNFVDENYFLKDSFYSGKSGAELSTIDVGVLTKPTFNNNSNDEVDGISTFVYVGNGFPVGTIGTNTKVSDKVSWDASGWGQLTTTNVFHTSFNGILTYPGFCGAHDLPGQYDPGQQFTIAYTTDNDMIRKALYYGWGGADGTLHGKYPPAEITVLTALTISDYLGINSKIYSQRPNAYNRLKAFIADLNNLPSPPSHFKAYVANANLPGHQPLVFLGQENPPPPPIQYGYIKLKKSSSDPTLTNGNSCYSLEGAEYGIYTNPECTNWVGTLKTDQNGDTNTIRLQTGTYYVKEGVAPQGFALDPTVHTVNITADNTETLPVFLQVTDTPKFDPVGVLLRKVDSATRESKASSPTATLEGAEFTFKFYKGIHTTDPALSGQQPVRQWVFSTNENGFAYYDKKFLVSGDELFYSPSGVASFPIGTVTIQETKSPQGFLLNDKVFIVNITEDFTSGTVFPYVEPEIPETLFSLNLVKKQAGKDVVIPNAVFSHTRPDGTVDEYTTDQNGQLIIDGLQWGVHTIKEKTAPNGYLLNPAEIRFKVNEDNSIEILSNNSTDETGNITLEQLPDGNLSMVVEDKVIPPSLKIIKQNNKGQVLAGAEFTLYSDEQCTQVIDKAVSDSNGQIQFDNIDIDKDYFLMETKAPVGYKLPIDKDGNFIRYKIRFESIPAQNIFRFIVNDKVYDNTTNDNMFYVENNTGLMKVVNTIGSQLPKTGSNTANILFIISSTLMLTSLILLDKRSRKNAEK